MGYSLSCKKLQSCRNVSHGIQGLGTGGPIVSALVNGNNRSTVSLNTSIDSIFHLFLLSQAQDHHLPIYSEVRLIFVSNPHSYTPGRGLVSQGLGKKRKFRRSVGESEFKFLHGSVQDTVFIDSTCACTLVCMHIYSARLGRQAISFYLC